MEKHNHYTPINQLIKAIITNQTDNIIVQQKIIKAQLRYVMFVKTKKEAEIANLLNSIAPNLVYPEKAYIATKSILSGLFSFGKNAEKDIDKVLSNDISLAKGFTLKSVPAYRINYSQLLIATLRTLKHKGIKINITNKSIPEINYIPITILEGNLRNSPIKQTLMIKNDETDIILLNRGDNFYVVGINIYDTDAIIDIIKNTFPKISIYKKNFTNCTSLNISKSDILFEQLLDKTDTLDIKNIKVDGSNFDFSPSAPDVIGYADAKYDEVKRLDINVNTFKNAVFDFGTNIDTIIDNTYNLFPKYHNGKIAFDEAVKAYQQKQI